MAGFSELVKNFNKIRDYSRDFFVYGYKCRNDYSRKSGRSYDNERRRIESYLSEYIKWETSARGKSLFISADTSDLSRNPLFSLWEAKSFTKNDCVLHFCLPDILRESPGITAKDAADILSGEYLGCFEDCAIPDVMTIRNKLNEYADAGLFATEKRGKTLRYFMASTPINPILDNIQSSLMAALQFFENIAPAGFLGYFIRRDSGTVREVFAFRHVFLSHTLDDEVLIQLSEAIAGKKSIRFENYSSRSKKFSLETVLPLKIAINVRHGRRFLLAYNFRLRNFFSYRLDYINNVEALTECDAYGTRLKELEEKLPFSWGVSLRKKARLEKVEMKLHIDEATEDYVLRRLKREGKNGTIERVADNTFIYRAEVFDTMEMVPWLRTFLGRIISIEGTNKPVIKQFIRDIYRMVRMYEA